MAQLKRHKGIVAVYAPKDGDFRVALCVDGTVLVRRGGAWKITKRTKADVDRALGNGALHVDDSPAGKALVTRANGDSHALEQCKKIRRIERRLALAIALLVAVMTATAPARARGYGGHHATRHGVHTR